MTKYDLTVSMIPFIVNAFLTWKS